MTAPYVELPDEVIARHFAHHSKFADRHIGKVWRFAAVRVPLDQLYCLYSDPGVSKDPQGLMGSIGVSPVGHAGASICSLASLLVQGLAAGRANTSNRALRDVIAFRDGGEEFITSRPEPMAVVQRGGRWFVREGTHRAIALAMLGVHIDTLDFESAQLLD